MFFFCFSSVFLLCFFIFSLFRSFSYISTFLFRCFIFICRRFPFSFSPLRLFPQVSLFLCVSSFEFSCFIFSCLQFSFPYLPNSVFSLPLPSFPSSLSPRDSFLTTPFFPPPPTHPPHRLISPFFLLFLTVFTLPRPSTSLNGYEENLLLGTGYVCRGRAVLSFTHTYAHTKDAGRVRDGRKAEVRGVEVSCQRTFPPQAPIA